MMRSNRMIAAIGAVAVSVLPLVAACVPAEELAREQAMADIAECRSLGYRPGTEGMADCRLRLREIRAQENVGRAYREYRFELMFSRHRHFPYYCHPCR